VVFPTTDTDFLLKEERKIYAHYPTNRSISNLLRNFVLALRILREEKPDVIVSTGAGVAVPFLYWGRIMRILTIYIESLTRVNRLSLTGRLVYPFVNVFLVQWPGLASRYKRAYYHGQVI